MTGKVCGLHPYIQCFLLNVLDTFPSVLIRIVFLTSNLFFTIFSCSNPASANSNFDLKITVVFIG